MIQLERLSKADVVYALALTIASLSAYVITYYILEPFVNQPNDFLGGMWATAATVFVFRDTHEASLSAGAKRFMATCVSFALCLIYLWIFPFEAVGMAALLGIGTLVMIKLGWRDDVVTAGITTAVVMVVAAMEPRNAWLQPLLRLLDTVVGIAVGIGVKWVASFLFYRYVGKPGR